MVHIATARYWRKFVQPLSLSLSRCPFFSERSEAGVDQMDVRLSMRIMVVA